MIYLAVRLVKRLLGKQPKVVQGPLDIPANNVDYLH